MITMKRPAQFSIQNEIMNLEGEVNDLRKKHSAGMTTVDDINRLKSKYSQIETKKKRLKRLEQGRQRSKAFRQTSKRLLQEAIDENPSLRKKLKVRHSSGHPPLTEDQPELLKTIIEIALQGSGVDERRQSEKIRAVKTLDELTKELKNHGFNLSRSGAYLHLLPRRSDTTEGRRHVRTAPVKLIKAQNDAHEKHPDGFFCTASIRAMEEIASVLGDNEVTFLSIDAKARVPIGITAASKQAPLMMHLDYKIKLSDHDFVKAPSHKLIPDVYAGIKIKSNSIGDQNAVTYSGPTYVAIRSAKHCQSSAYGHNRDMKELFSLKEFDSIMQTDDGSPKPVRMITCDGGPDENPRYWKTIESAIDIFIVDNLDVLFIATNAPGRSAFNRVERRMAPLSRQLAGVVLPHEHFGSHLDSALQTVDEELEKRNFAHAGKILAEIWNQISIDDYPVVAKYVDEHDSEPKLQTASSQWKAKHVRESQYMLQIVKCTDTTCCSTPRSSYFTVINDRFLPGPVPLRQSKGEGLKVELFADDKTSYPHLFLRRSLDLSIFPQSARSYPILPYDYACPTIHPLLAKRVCTHCRIYHASVKSLINHKKVCTGSMNAAPPTSTNRIRPLRLAAKRQRELMCVFMSEGEEVFEWHDDDEVDSEGLTEPSTIVTKAGTPVIKRANVYFFDSE